MSQLARLFVVLNFLLAAGFLYSAAMFLGLNHEWKKNHEKVSTELKTEKEDRKRSDTTQKTRIDELTHESSALKEERGNLQSKVASLTTENQQHVADKAAAAAALAKEQGNVASANEALKRTQDELNKRTDEANKLRTDAATAQGNERKANDELEKAKTEIRTRDNSIAELEKTKTTQGEQIAELEITKRIAQENGVDLSNIVQAPAIPDAKVIGVDMGMKLVQISAGKNQKLPRGALVDIVRGSKYVGRIRIDQVDPNSSAGTLTVLAPNETVQVGDRATNTLN